MTRPHQVTVDVVVREHGGKKVIKDIGDESRKTGTAFGQMGKDAKSLSKQLFDMDIQLRKSAMELERTGDTSLIKSINKQRRELNALVKVRKDILGITFGQKDDDAGGGLAAAGVKAGTSFGMSLVDSATKAMSSGGTKFVAAAAAAIGVASPFIGAALASAVLGTSGTLGIAGGIALAAQDQRVKQAATDMGHTFMREFTAIGQPFVAPTIDALKQLEAASIDIAGKLAPEFDALADHVAPLTGAFVEMVRRLLPGFKEALKSAEPVLNALADALPGLGEDLGEMFDMIASQPEGAVAGLHDLIGAIGFTAKAVGALTAALSNYYAMVISVGRVTTSWSLQLPQWVKDMGMLDEVAQIFVDSSDAMKDAFRDAPEIVTDFGAIAKAAEKVKEEMQGLKNAIDDVFDPQMDLERATLRYEKGLIDLKEELTDGKRTLDIHTEAGQDNREAILNQIQAIKDLRDATATVPEKVDAANEAYDRQLESLRKTLIMLGYNKNEINNIVDAWKRVPAEQTTEYRYPGLLESLRAARELSALLGGASAAQTARFRAGDSSGYGGGRASGGYMAPGMSYDVAESGTGVERVKMLHGGGAVVSNAGQWSAAGGGVAVGGWGGGQTMHLVIDVRSSGDDFDSLIARKIRAQVAEVGGGSVQRTYGRNDR